jgi:hypothetical protein
MSMSRARLTRATTVTTVTTSRQRRFATRKTLVETDGAPDGYHDFLVALRDLKVLVDPQSRDAFAFQPHIVPANRVAVPAP